jgi:hypothetical protein
MHSETNYSSKVEFPGMEAPDREGPPRKCFKRLADALEDARQGADKIEIEWRVLDFLYGRTRWKSVTRADWEQQVRIATAFDENLRRFGSARLLKEIADQVGVSLKAAVAPERTLAPALVITYHGSFSVTLRRLFRNFFPDGVAIAANGVYAAGDGAFALFAAREALLAEKPAFMAPDGRYGREAGTVSVLGAQLPLTDGAPFLAHATGCKVEWLALSWTGRGFAIEALAGPQRVAGEAFRDYRERFYHFYAARLEEAFTGNPANLPLTANWRLMFDAMLAGKVYRFRRPTRQIA